jgi:hypothetical protein
VIYDLFRLVHRRRRYREVSVLIIQEITRKSQERMDRSLTEAYQQGLAKGIDSDQLKQTTQKMVDAVNEVLSKENARRIRQWTESILEEEEKL